MIRNIIILVCSVVAVFELALYLSYVGILQSTADSHQMLVGSLEVAVFALLILIFCITSYTRSKLKKTRDLGEINSDDIIVLLTKALEISPDGVALTNLQSEFVWVNEGMSELTGYSSEELIGETPRLFRSGLHDDSFYRHLWSTILSGDSWHGELTNKRKDGSLYAEEQVITPVRDKDGNVSYFVMIKQDITERKQSEEDLQIRNKFLERAEEIARVGYWRVSLPSGDVEWSDEIYRIHGLDRSTFEPNLETAINAYHPEDRDRVSDVMRQAIEHGKNFEFRLRIVRPDGSIRHVATKGECLIDEQGLVDTVFGVFMDVTESQEYEDLLVLAREEAEEVSRFKSALLANLTHEIRTPLTTILGYAQLLQDELSPVYQESVINIMLGGKRLLSTLESLLELSSLEAGLNSVKIDEKINIGDELASLVSQLHPQAREKGLTLVSEIPARGMEGFVDKKCLLRILENLIDNAIKFTERGEIIVRVRVLTTKHGGWEISVKDTGIGIEEDFLPHLFEPFRQASTGTARSHEGVGLGLAVSKNLVMLLGGRLSVKTKVATGSTFTLSLPQLPKNKRQLKNRPPSRSSQEGVPNGINPNRDNAVRGPIER